jgi:hypothetical protein
MDGVKPSPGFDTSSRILKSITNHPFFKKIHPTTELHLLPKPVHSGLPANPSRLNSIKRMSLSLKRQ